MEFPVTLQHTLHKFGGRITRIDRIGHSTAKPKAGRSQDAWFFVGDVTWDDGTSSTGIEIAPYQLCIDGNERTEVDGLLEALNAYLTENGTWRHRPEKPEGWTAHVR